MPTFPITHISRHGPNKNGDVLFLESVPPDYRMVDERKKALEREFAQYEIVIYRTSRRPRGKKGKFRLSREKPSASHSVSDARERDSASINYGFYAIARTKTAPPPTEAQMLEEARGICNDHGQQGDP